MNQERWIRKIARALAGLGVDVAAIDRTPPPACLIVKVSRFVQPHGVEAIRTAFNGLLHRLGWPEIPIVLINDNVRAVTTLDTGALRKLLAEAEAREPKVDDELPTAVDPLLSGPEKTICTLADCAPAEAST